MSNLYQVPMYTAISDLIPLSLNSTPCHVDCSFTITHEDITYHVYHASICYRDILCYTDQGVFTYLVDSYGDRHTYELHDWELDTDT